MDASQWADGEPEPTVDDRPPQLPEPSGPPMEAEHATATFYRKPGSRIGYATGTPEAACAGRYR